MKNFIDGMNSLPQWLKIVLALPMFDIIWVIYRIARSVDKENAAGILIAVIAIIIGIPFLWLIDIITIVSNGSVWWID